MIDLNIFNSIAYAQETTASAGPTAAFNLNAQLFIAQLINFAVVLFVLWKFAFKPITKKLTERTERIEKSLNDAERITKEKAEFEKWRQEEMSKARTEASAVITQAQTDANKVKDSTLHQTKEEQQKLIDQAKKQIEQEKNSQLQSAKAELADLVTMATEKVLRQKLDGKKDAELIKESIKSI